jgi:hypothetical protein
MEMPHRGFPTFFGLLVSLLTSQDSREIKGEYVYKEEYRILPGTGTIRVPREHNIGANARSDSHKPKPKIARCVGAKGGDAHDVPYNGPHRPLHVFSFNCSDHQLQLFSFVAESNRLKRQMFNPLDLPCYRPPRDKNTWPEGSEVRTKFGAHVLWWPKKYGGFHMSSEELEPYRLLGDGKVDRILRLMEDEGSPLGASDDLLLLAEKAVETEGSDLSPSQQELSSFLKTYESLPSWVNKEQLRRGQEVFLAYTPVASLSLYYRSLIAGFSIPKIAAVVRSTAYLAPPSRPDQVLQRLLDTGELTASCMGLGCDSLLPGGQGWRTALHVRILHAKVRYALLRRQGKRKWDVNKFGIPINQEDMSATLLAFSVNVLVGIDFVSGTSLSERERLDYLALWRYIGWLLGVETESDKRVEEEPSTVDLPPLDPCGPGTGATPNTILNSSSLLQSMIFHLMDPDETSVEIAHHLLKASDRKPPSAKLGKIPEDFYKNELFYFRALQCRRFIGDPLADALDLPFHPSAWKRTKLYLKSTFFLLLFRVYTLATMWSPFLRRRIVRMHERALVTFHETWMKTHKSKMARAIARNEKASVIEEDEGNEDSRINETAVASSCPFSMTAPPQ